MKQGGERHLEESREGDERGTKVRGTEKEGDETLEVKSRQEEVRRREEE